MSGLRVAEGHNTILHHPVTGDRHVFESGDELPTWAAQLITNPELVDGDLADVPLPGGVAPDDAAKYGRSPAAAAFEAPPRSGSGSGVGPWREYATKLGIDFPEKATAKEIQKLVDDHQPQANAGLEPDGTGPTGDGTPEGAGDGEGSDGGDPDDES